MGEETVKTLAISMRKQGLSIRHVAERLGVAPSTIERWTDGHGTDRAALDKQWQDLHDKIVTMHNEGMSMKAVARELEISPSTVHRHLSDR